jgi:geranylgeranyl diphosphate synthase type II
MDIARYLEERRSWVDRTLASYLPRSASRPSLLHRAIRYSLFAGGKRIRPILALAAFEAVRGGSRDGKEGVKKVLPIASAIELVHTYSLVHDDLPAMDDDDLRRGRPTNHKVFGEAVAILAGDSLLTEAFALIADPRHSSRRTAGTALEVIRELSLASGSRGMIAGQIEDIRAQGASAGRSTVHYIHLHKTAALIRAAVRIGGLLAGASRRALAALTRYGEKAGLAFQIADDLLDLEGTAEETGKRVRKDRKLKKATYPGVIGAERSRLYAGRLVREAVGTLEMFGERAEPLRALAQFVVDRKK